MARLNDDVTVKENETYTFGYFCLLLGGVEPAASLHLFIGVRVDIGNQGLRQPHQQFIFLEMVPILDLFYLSPDIFLL